MTTTTRKKLPKTATALTLLSQNSKIFPSKYISKTFWNNATICCVTIRGSPFFLTTPFARVDF